MKKHSGFTLIEIMIALILGLIVVGATISIYIAVVSSSSNIIKSARLNHDMESVMTLMINDIKRAGYWGGANVAADSRVNPFTTGNANIQIPSANCILYSYDADGDSNPEDNEYYGFKLENNSIKIRKTGTTTADCANGTWEEFIVGDQLNITALQFSFVPAVGILPATSRCLNVTTPPPTNPVAWPCNAVSGDNLAEKRLVNILLAGQLKPPNDTVIKNLNGTVEVRNNRLLTQP